MCDYETVESVNEELFNNLSELVRLPFFKYFQVRRPSYRHPSTPLTTPVL